MNAWYYSSLLVFILLLGAGCQEAAVVDVEEPFVLEVPEGFPQPVIPDDNQLTHDRVALGKKIFYDPVLSLDSTFSCNSCHKQEQAFSLDVPVSIGIKGRMGTRNIPTLANVAYHPYFFKEGGSPSLEAQVLGPICAFDEFGFNAALLAERLKGDPVYDPLAQEAYGRPMDLWVVTRALAAFERTLLSGNSLYDAYRRGEIRSLSRQAMEGMDLFYSERLACGQCHGGFDFSDYSFQNNGLNTEYEDEGRYRVTVDSADLGKFKVPTLRNIAQTAPYMHDGSLASLEEVIEHYDQGGKGHPNQHEAIQPLNLTVDEKSALKAFLENLTDQEFLENDAFK